MSHRACPGLVVVVGVRLLVEQFSVALRGNQALQLHAGGKVNVRREEGGGVGGGRSI